MDLSRRELLTAAGGASLAYVFHLACSPEEEPAISRPKAFVGAVEAARLQSFDYRNWLVIAADGSVTAYTGRTELGQGLTTVLYNVICQGLELPPDKVEVVMGDTGLCPDDGPTTGSSATRIVGWGYWKACLWIRVDLVRLAARSLGCAEEELVYREGRVVRKDAPVIGLGIGELGDGEIRAAVVDRRGVSRYWKPYVDRGTLRVDGEAIVTGTRVYTGDLHPEGCLYGGFLQPGYHITLARLQSVDLTAAEQTPDLVAIRRNKRRVAAIGKTFRSVQRALEAVEVRWEEPSRPRALDNEREIRAGARLVQVIEEVGRVKTGLRDSQQVISETYITQYASQVPIETETALARLEGDQASVWVGTQHPFLGRFKVAEALELDASKVRVIGMPVGGAFGVKVEHEVPVEAAQLARWARAPVKCVYSRKQQFQRRARYKESVIVDIKTGVTGDGRLLAREIDIYQDEGFGTTEVYEVPHASTRLYHSRLPVRHATMRGTSYTQNCFALESHTDTVAKAVGVDPVEFRKRTVVLPTFRTLLDACAEMIDYGNYQPPEDHGIGFALCNHGGRQLGVVAAEVSVSRASGTVRVERLVGAYDVGVVINRNSLSAGVKGSMIWGLGYALFEEVELDGHRAYTESLAQYRIPRFSDIPPIELAFFDHQSPGSPRGCGELPVIPTVGAICNAVYDAIGARFYTLPMTPERVKKALA